MLTLIQAIQDIRVLDATRFSLFMSLHGNLGFLAIKYAFVVRCMRTTKALMYGGSTTAKLADYCTGAQWTGADLI